MFIIQREKLKTNFLPIEKTLKNWPLIHSVLLVTYPLSANVTSNSTYYSLCSVATNTYVATITKASLCSVIAIASLLGNPFYALET